jgi:hypothetical protein
LEVAVIYKVIAGHERLSVTTGHGDAAVAGIEYITALHAMFFPTADGYSPVANIPKMASSNEISFAIVDLYSIASCCLKCDTPEGDMTRTN